jgi:helix-turn-helix protein
MTETFGARLRTQREEKGVSLDHISRHTKIKVSLLEALERDDLTYWPHGLFGRAYIRSYAQLVGLESEPLIGEFLQLHPDPPDELAIAAAAPPPGFSSAIRSAVGAIPALLWGGERIERSVKRANTPATPVSRPMTAAPSLDTSELPASHLEERSHEDRLLFEIMATPNEQSEPSSSTPEIAVLADLCTRIQHADNPRQLLPVLSAVAQMLEARGLVLWLWDSTAAALRPWLAHGYSSRVMAQLPNVRREDDNAIAASFRTADTCIVDKGAGETGAIVVPLIGGSRCLGALALELRDGAERRPFVRDAAVVIATLLVPFAEATPLPAAATA